MIIFYNKQTGKIEGTINGRVHDKTHLKMWVGSKKDNGRLIFEWVHKKGKWKPDYKQAEEISNIEKGKKRLSDYKVNLETKLLEIVS